jgi:hypothetical protein
MLFRIFTSSVIHLFLKMARKFDEAAHFICVQLNEQESGTYDKCHPDYARRDKIDLAWERISRAMKKSDICVNVCIYIYI